MVLVILGASGSGKSTIESELCKHYGFQKIISYTTRTPRENEENGKDYYFTNNETFDDMLKNGLFAEHDEYSLGRKYGTLKSDFVDGCNKVVVLTPNGLRKLKANLDCEKEKIVSVLVNASLGNRMKRYIDRCGDNFGYNDKDEICSRVERDYGMFLGMENEVDFVVNNDRDTVKGAVEEIVAWLNDYQKK